MILFTGGVPGPGGMVWGGAWSGRCAWSRGVCMGCLVPGGPGGDPPETATAVGGTHPTGMHSCSMDRLLNSDLLFDGSVIELNPISRWIGY